MLLFAVRSTVATATGMPCQLVKTAARTCHNFRVKAAAYPISQVKVRRDWTSMKTVRDRF